MSRPSVSQLGSSTPLELVRLEDRLVMSGNPIAAQVREMTFETLNTGDFSYAIDARGDVMVTARRDGKIGVMASDGSGARVLDGPGGLVKEARLSPDGTMVAGVGFGKTVMVKNVETGAVVQQWVFGDYVSGVEWSADGTQITADVDSSGVRLLTVGSTEMRSMGAGSFEGGVLADGRMVASKNNGIELEGGVRWNTGRVMIAVNVHGSLVAAGGLDGLLGVWDTETNGKVYLGGHSGAVTSCRFSPDGRYVASTDTNGLVLVHDVATGEIVTSETGAGAISAVFSSNQKDVVYVRNGGSSGTVIDRIAMPEGMWIVPEVEEEGSEGLEGLEGLEAVNTEASDAVFAAFVAERDFSMLSAYAADAVLDARGKVEGMRIVVAAKQETVDALQIAYDSAVAALQAAKDAYVAAESGVSAVGVARKDAENSYWVTYGQYKYSDAGKIAAAQMVWDSAKGAEQTAIAKKAAAGTAYAVAQTNCVAATEALGVGQEALQVAEDTLSREEDACRVVEVQAFAGELVAPTEQELWVEAKQEDARGKLTEYGFAKWDAAFALSGYETAPPIWKTGSVSFGLSMQQLPESLFNGTGCVIDKEALILNIARSHDRWLFGETYEETWAMAEDLAQAHGTTRDAILYMQRAGLEGANEETHALITAFQTMVSDLFCAELARRTGGDVRAVATVSHPLLPSRAAMETCVLQRFDALYANYCWMVRQSDEGHTLTAAASTSDGPNQQENHELAHAHNLKVIMSTEGTTSVAQRLYSYTHTAYPEAQGVLIAMNVAGVVSDDVIAGVRVVAEADIGDGSVEVGGVEVEEQGLEFGEEIEAYMSAHMDEILDAIKNSMLSMASGTEVEVHIAGREVVQHTSNDLIAKLDALKQGTITVDSYAVLGQYQDENPYDAAQAFIDAKDQILYGNYSEKVTLLGTAGQIIIGFTGADIAGDFRDVVYDIQNWEWSWGHAGSTGLDAIGIIPIVGVIKNVKHADEIVLLVKNGERVEVIQGIRKASNTNILAFMDIAELEGQIGHVLERHIGKNSDYLMNRIIQEGIPEASTFTNNAIASQAIQKILGDNISDINEWLKSAKTGDTYHFLEINSDTPLGIVMKNEESVFNAYEAHHLKLVIKARQLENGTMTFDLLTAKLSQ